MRLDIAQNFDEYARKARLYPAFIAIFPAVFFTIFVLGLKDIVELALIVFSSFGVTLLIANLVRGAGRKIEPELYRRWGGKPTTILLRHAADGKNKTRLRRMHTLLSSFYGEKLPDAIAEKNNPKAADDFYEVATKSLIAVVRSDQRRFARVHEENITYGFRRNMFAIRHLAITVAALTLAVEVFLLIFGNISQYKLLTGAGVSLIAVATWLLAIRETWVKDAAFTYAERLFEALEELVHAPLKHNKS